MQAAAALIAPTDEDNLRREATSGQWLDAAALAITSPLQEVLSNVRVVLATQPFGPAVTREAFQLATGDYGELVIPPLLARAAGRSLRPGPKGRP